MCAEKQMIMKLKHIYIAAVTKISPNWFDHQADIQKQIYNVPIGWTPKYFTAPLECHHFQHGWPQWELNPQYSRCQARRAELYRAENVQEFVSAAWWQLSVTAHTDNTVTRPTGPHVRCKGLPWIVSYTYRSLIIHVTSHRIACVYEIATAAERNKWHYAEYADIKIS